VKYNELMNVKELAFEIRQFGSAKMFDEDFLVNTTLRSEYRIEHVAQLYMLDTHVASILRKVTVTAPATRWDALKELFVPKRWQKYAKIQYRDLSAEAYAMLPHLDLERLRSKYDVKIAIHDAPLRWRTGGDE